MERLIIIATFGAVDTTGAAFLAGALFDRSQGGFPEVGQQGKTLLADANAAGIAVVDENLGPFSIGVHGGGQTADVPAVAHGKEGQ